MTDTPTFLYVLKLSRTALLVEGPTDDETRILERHVAYLERLTDEGVVVLFGRTQNADESTIGLVIFEARDEDAAREVMQADPAVDEGLMTATLFPYRIAGMRSPR